jgi:hypothetical protein
MVSEEIKKNQRRNKKKFSEEIKKKFNDGSQKR